MRVALVFLAGCGPVATVDDEPLSGRWTGTGTCDGFSVSVGEDVAVLSIAPCIITIGERDYDEPYWERRVATIEAEADIWLDGDVLAGPLDQGTVSCEDGHWTAMSGWQASVAELDVSAEIDGHAVAFAGRVELDDPSR